MEIGLAEIKSGVSDRFSGAQDARNVIEFEQCARYRAAAPRLQGR